jgi:hypothetical protein
LKPAIIGSVPSNPSHQPKHLSLILKRGGSLEGTTGSESSASRSISGKMGETSTHETSTEPARSQATTCPKANLQRLRSVRLLGSTSNG